MPASETELHRALGALACAETERARFRAEALAILLNETAARAGAFHAFSPRVPLETGAFVGISAEHFAQGLASGDAHAVELARWRDRALAQGGVAADTEVFAPKEREKTAYYRSFAAPLRLRSCALVHLVMRGRVGAVVALMRLGDARAFEPETLERLRALAPTLTVCDASYEHSPAERAPLVAQRPQCRDTRLTAREQELVELVALGQRNEDIAVALGLSPNTVRNRLAIVFRKLGVGNRAELVRVAVLR